MNALPGYSNVFPMHASEAAFTAHNSAYAPKSHDAELADAAPFWTDMHDAPARREAPQWQFRDGDGRIIRTEFPALKSQSEIDAEGVPGVAALLVMCAATFTVIVGSVVGSWLLGVM